MGKIITYLIYILIAIAIYVLAKGAFSGDINSNSTVKEVATEVKDGSVQTIKDIKNSAVDTVNEISKD